MAVNSTDPLTGAPQFADNAASELGVDLTALGSYSADVGNRIVRASLAALEAYPFKRAGLVGHALDSKTDYVHSGSGWIPGSGLRGGTFAVASGKQFINVASGVTVTFPAGTFTVPPVMQVTPVNAGSVVVPHVTNLTKDSFFLRIFLLSGVAATGNCDWTASQATPTSAGG